VRFVACYFAGSCSRFLPFTEQGDKGMFPCKPVTDCESSNKLEYERTFSQFLKNKVHEDSVEKKTSSRHRFMHILFAFKLSLSLTLPVIIMGKHEGGRKDIWGG